MGALPAHPPMLREAWKGTSVTPYLRKRVTTLDLSPGNFYDLSTVKVSG